MSVVIGVLGIVVGFVLGRVTAKHLVTLKVETPSVVTPNVVEPRFRLAWKQGDLRTNNMTEVAQTLVKLRKTSQPYTYIMDGRVIEDRR